jgi:hypothetical protein
MPTQIQTTTDLLAALHTVRTYLDIIGVRTTANHSIHENIASLLSLVCCLECFEEKSTQQLFERSVFFSLSGKHSLMCAHACRF